MNTQEHLLNDIIPSASNAKGWLGAKDCFERKNIKKSNETIYKLKSSEVLLFIDY